MSTKFYTGQKDYIPKLNELDDSFNEVIEIYGGQAEVEQAVEDAQAAAIAAQTAADDAAAAAASAESEVAVAVADAVAALVDSSPSTLDTLNELAAALADDPDFATTMTNALALKAPLASPALTGVPVAPTAEAGTNTTQLATTEFVTAVETLVNTALALKAPLASPNLTGTPTAPTATAGTNTTQLATTEFVTAVETLVNTALALKAPLASPSLTGSVGINKAGASTKLHIGAGSNVTTDYPIRIDNSSNNYASGYGAYGISNRVNATNLSINYTMDIGQDLIFKTADTERMRISSTGVVTASTAAAGTNTTQLATTAFVTAVETLANAAIALKAPLASPTFTGTPTAPTAAQFDNSTKLATTAFLGQRGIQASGIATITTSAAVALTSVGGTVVLNSASAIAPTLPAASGVVAGGRIEFWNGNTGIATITRAGSDTINTNGSTITSIALGAGDTLTLESNGSSGWYAVGGSAQLGASASFGKSFGSSGYQKLPSGLIMQWGQVTQTDTGGAVAFTFTLPISFPTASRQAFGTIANGNTINYSIMSVEGLNTGSVTGFTYGPSGSRTYRIFVIGD